MARKELIATGPARLRVGLPVLADGTKERPLLVGLGGSTRAACNNGCEPCLTERVEGEVASIAGRHVVVRDREPTLEATLPARIRALADEAPASLTLLTNGRMLGIAPVVPTLLGVGVTRFVVKLFGLDAAAHDAHTRVPGSFEQALAGIARARALDAAAARSRVLVTFPLAAGRTRLEHHALARRLTGCDAIEHPEPEVETHANEFRYDVVVQRDGVRDPRWTEDNFFPMAHVHVGPFCNLRCTYCNVHGGDDQRLYEPDYVESILDAAARQVLHGHERRGTPSIDFIGGEPTAHPDLPRFVRRARSLGFRKVYVCTSGTLLLRPGYLDGLVEAGLTGVRFSLHDHRADVARALADVPSLGERYVEVARMLLSRTDLHLHLYRILLAETMDALPDYVRWVAAHNHTGKPIDLTFGLPSMRGRLFENRHLYPPLAGLREKLAEAIAIARGLGAEPLVHHAPACLVPSEPERVACLHVATTQVEAASGRSEEQSFEGDARYGRACADCAARAAGCHGLPAAYWEADAEEAERWLTPLAAWTRR